MELKILNIGTDASALKEDSPLAKRIKEYASLVERYDIVVPAREETKVRLADRAEAIGAKGKNKISRFFEIYKLAGKLIRENKYDLITVQDPYFLALAGFRLARKYRLGLEIQVHGWERFGGLRKLIAKYVLPRADAVRTVSQRLKKQLIEEFGVKEERVTVVPIYVETKIKNQKSKIKNNEKFIFLTVGRLVPVKNIGLQIRAMAEISKKLEVRSKKLELWIVGKGPEESKLKVKSEKLKVKDNIKFFGWHSDLSEFYGQADVFMLTSFAEGWPLVIAEAASYGLPIIMTDMGSAGELIIDGQNGLVVPVNDQESLVKAMIKLIEDESLRNRLGEKAREAALALPNKEKILELYLESWRKAKKE